MYVHYLIWPGRVGKGDIPELNVAHQGVVWDDLASLHWNLWLQVDELHIQQNRAYFYIIHNYMNCYACKN